MRGLLKWRLPLHAIRNLLTSVILLCVACGPYPVMDVARAPQHTDLDKTWAAQWPGLTIMPVNIIQETAEIQRGFNSALDYMRVVTGMYIEVEPIVVEDMPQAGDPHIAYDHLSEQALSNNGPFVVVFFMDHLYGEPFYWGETVRSEDGSPVWFVVATRTQPPLVDLQSLFYHNVVAHELGHVFKVPYRKFHRIAGDSSHCTNSSCLMAGASTVTWGHVTRVLLHEWNIGFCGDCLVELDYQAKIRFGTWGERFDYRASNSMSVLSTGLGGKTRLIQRCCDPRLQR